MPDVDRDKWKDIMPPFVTNVSRNDNQLCVRISCGVCGSLQLKQKFTAMLDTEEKVLANLAEKALSKHASCVRYSSPTPTSAGSKRVGHPPPSSDSVRSPARGTAAVLSASGGMARVENTERRLEIELSRCASVAARELAAVKHDFMMARAAREVEHTNACGQYRQHAAVMTTRRDELRVSYEALKAKQAALESSHATLVSSQKDIAAEVTVLKEAARQHTQSNRARQGHDRQREAKFALGYTTDTVARGAEIFCSNSKIESTARVEKCTYGDVGL